MRNQSRKNKRSALTNPEGSVFSLSGISPQWRERMSEYQKAVDRAQINAIDVEKKMDIDVSKADDATFFSYAANTMDWIEWKLVSPSEKVNMDDLSKLDACRVELKKRPNLQSWDLISQKFENLVADLRKLSRVDELEIRENEEVII